MNERDALLTTALRAVETVDRDRRTWTDDDRSWSTQAAAEVVGEGASPAAFIAHRAQLALERLRTRDAGFVRIVDGLLWRPWIGLLTMALALVAGAAIDRLGSGPNINLLALPVLGLLAWNVAVYLVLLAGSLSRLHRQDREPGPLRRLLVRWLTGAGRWLHQHRVHMPEAVLSSLLKDWSRVAAPLYAARVTRILHLAAAMFAFGIVAGLYLRGLAFEYRAGWESTFLDVETVHRILSVMLAPGVWLTGQPLTDAIGLAAIRFGTLPATENAAPWLHLMAATIAVIVILPRLTLGLASGLVERQRSTRLITRIEDPYYQRLLRGYRAGPVHLTVIPYSYHPAPATMAGLQGLMARVFGGNAATLCATPVGYGQEEALPATARPDGRGPTFALFSLAATPEREAQGAFVRSLRAMVADKPLLLLIDEAPWHARFDADLKRLEERRSAWRDELADLDIAPIFVDLAHPDLSVAQEQVERQLEQPA